MVGMPQVWQGKWVWREAGQPLRNSYLKARKAFHVDGKVHSCVLRVSADSRYVLYVNGAEVARGPARSFPKHQSYDTVDIAEHLTKGENVLAILVHQYGESTMQYLHRGKAGFIVDGALLLKDGNEIRLDTDKSWKVLEAREWDKSTERVTMMQGFQEHYDARKQTTGWRLASFDEAGWDNAFVVGAVGSAPWIEMEERGIPMLREEMVYPDEVVSTGTGKLNGCDFTTNVSGYLAKLSYEREDTPSALSVRNLAKGALNVEENPNGCFSYAVLDFRREYCGPVNLEIEGARGNERVAIGHAETLRDGIPWHCVDGISEKYMADVYTARPGSQRWETFSQRAGRYMLLVVAGNDNELGIAVSIKHMVYPVEKVGAFECSDETLNRIWRLSRATNEVCMFDSYVDCPNREYNQWMGDARTQALMNYYAFGDRLLAKRLLRQAAQSRCDDGILWAIFPAEHSHPALRSADYSLVWVMALWDYYFWTGKDDPLHEHFDVMLDVLDWFRRKKDPNGLVGHFDDPQCYLDVDQRLRNEKQNTILNMFYICGLRAGANIAERVGKPDTAEALRTEADEVAQAVNRDLFSPELGVYVNGYDPETDRQSELVSMHANAMAIDLGVSQINDVELAKRTLLASSRVGGEPPLVAQPYFFFYVFEALEKAGLCDELVDELRTRWSVFLERDAVTIWEWWPEKVEKVDFGSYCHAWGSSALYYLPRVVLGVRPTAPGFAEYVVEPNTCGLECASGAVPTPHGRIDVDWRLVKGNIELSITAPEGARGTAILPDGRTVELLSGINEIE
jgi:hypothetical protein